MPPINRYVGPKLVNATYDQLTNCVGLGRYPVLKVVSTDTYGLMTPQGQHVNWNDSNRLDVCNLTRWTIVRTQTGDHGPIDHTRVAAELRPWYAAKKRSRWGINPQAGYSNLLIELGNEPNNHANFKSDEFIWTTRWHLLRAIDAVRQLDSEFGVTAKIICTSLAPRYWYDPAQNIFVHRWLEIFTATDNEEGRNLLNDCSFFAVHFFAQTSWTDERTANGNNMRFMVDAYNRFVGSRRHWIITEFGLRNGSANAAACDDYTKGHRYAGLMHFNEGPGQGTPSHKPLPSHVWGGTYFQLNTFVDHSSSSNDGGYAYYPPNGDWSYRNRLNGGT